MNSERLLRLADFLENEVPKHKLNMSRWMTEDRDREDRTKDAFRFLGPVNEGSKVEVIEPMTCQTIGCAMGWATTIPEFKEAGLVLLGRSDSTGGSVALKISETQYLTEYDACAKFFDIRYGEAYGLFDPVAQAYCGNDPKLVAESIRKFVVEAYEA
jgi:hypothetical protein